MRFKKANLPWELAKGCAVGPDYIQKRGVGIH
jgi:hypothetical protein